MNATNIDTSAFIYTSPKACGPAKVINLYNRHSNASLELALPEMLTWGAQEGMDNDKNPNGKFTMSLQFPSADFSNPEMESTLESFKSLIDKVKADAKTHSKDWFGKECSADVIDDKFNEMLKYPKIKNDPNGTRDYNKMPTLTVKFPCWGEDKKWQSEIYDERGDPLYLKGWENDEEHGFVKPIDFVRKQDQVVTLLQCGGIWIVSGKVSITWNLKQALVKDKDTPDVGICHLPVTGGKRARDESNSISATVVDDSDDEQENANVDADVETEEPEEVVMPEENDTHEEETVKEEEPAGKKKRVNKKK